MIPNIHTWESEELLKHKSEKRFLRWKALAVSEQKLKPSP